MPGEAAAFTCIDKWVEIRDENKANFHSPSNKFKKQK
jgi:hypothetical protein